MFFFFTCGTHNFTSELKEYAGLAIRCNNCGNFSARAFKRWDWFTFCFIPVLPLSFGSNREVGCGVCNFWQDLKWRQQELDAIKMNGGHQAIPMHGGGDGGYGGYGKPPPGQQFK